MMKKFNYVYITTNLVNLKQYVGDHSTDNLNDSYLGSGLALKKAVKKYSKGNFERKILECFNTKQEAFDAQEKWINEYNTLRPNGYNISPKGGHNVKDCISEETKRKIGKGNKGKRVSLETKEKLSKAFSGENNPMFKYKYTDTQIKHFSDINSGRNNPMFGSNMSEINKHLARDRQLGRKKSKEEKEKISIGNTGKIRSEKLKKHISEKLKGRKISNVTKKKISESKQGISRKSFKCPHCGRLIAAGNYNRWHGDNCKLNINI